MKDDLQSAWAAQTVEIRRFSAAELQAAATALDRTVRWRNLREYAAGVLVVLLFTPVVWWAADPLGQVGAALVVAGTGVVLGVLWVRGTPSQAASVAEDCLAWRRRELVRQRDLLASIWRWYLGPLVPGLALLMLSSLLRADTASELSIGIGVVAAMVALFVGIGRMNHHAAAALQHELDGLEDPGGRNDPG